jgi:hypothetical protein
VAAVAGTIEVLRLLESAPAQLTPKQASTCRKAALLAIGDHIKGGGLHWAKLPAAALWEYVSKIARHRMKGPQLQGLYVGLEAQRGQARESGQGQQSEERLRQAQQEEEQVAACMAAARALLRQQPLASAGGTGGVLTPAHVGIWRSHVLAPSTDILFYRNRLNWAQLLWV